MSGQPLTTTESNLKPAPAQKRPGPALLWALLAAAALHLSLLGPAEFASAPGKARSNTAPAIAVQLAAPLALPDSAVTTQASSAQASAPASKKTSLTPGPAKSPPAQAKGESALVALSELAKPSQFVMPDFNEVPAIAKPAPDQAEQDASSITGNDNSDAELPFYPAASLTNAQLKMAIQRQEPGKNPVYGEGEISYSKNSDKLYQIELRASLSLLFASINLYQLSSQGQVVSGLVGFQPHQMNEKRRNRPETATHFDAANRSVTFSASNKTLNTSAQVQDKASFLLQLSAIALANPDFIQSGQKIHLQVAEEREMTVFSFEVVAQETLQTKAGPMPSWHLRRPAKAGAYNSVLEIWLAPAQQWLPVQIRNTEANGAVTTQTVTELKIGSTN